MHDRTDEVATAAATALSVVVLVVLGTAVVAGYEPNAFAVVALGAAALTAAVGVPATVLAWRATAKRDARARDAAYAAHRKHTAPGNETWAADGDEWLAGQREAVFDTMLGLRELLSTYERGHPETSKDAEDLLPDSTGPIPARGEEKAVRALLTDLLAMRHHLIQRGYLAEARDLGDALREWVDGTPYALIIARMAAQADGDRSPNARAFP